ncbi:hypothetical protein ACC704_32145 [Rhizobium johnstonii]
MAATVKGISLSTIPDSIRNLTSNSVGKTIPAAKANADGSSFGDSMNSALSRMSAEAQSHFSHNIIEGNDTNNDGYVTREEYTKNLMIGLQPKTVTEALDIWKQTQRWCRSRQ